MTKRGIATGVIIVLITLVASCQKDAKIGGILSPEKEEQFSAGRGTVFNEGPNAFGFQIEDLTGLDELNFFVGNSFFNQNWVQAPASTTARDGLGPLFNSRSCSGCHFKDGRGKPPLSPQDKALGLLFRLTKAQQNSNGENIGDSHYGGQLQDRAINSVDAEGQMTISYEGIPVKFTDGTSYTLQKPIYQITNTKYGPFDADVVISPRIANQMIGLGFLEAINEQTLLNLADPNDLDNDGISGKPNYVWSVVHQEKRIGRFGWKANQPNLKQQTAGAFNGDMGITSSLFPNQNCAPGQDACLQAANGGDPEIDDDDLDKVTLYTASLAVPARRNWDDQTVLQGKALFNRIGCNKCHIPKIKTGTHPTISAFSNQTIRPYTDLLLHNMGPDLADGINDQEASGMEWRTPPLWGIGLIKTVNSHTRYLHDGRAEGLMEAVLWHDGEAKASKEEVLKFSSLQRDQLLKFLESL